MHDGDLPGGAAEADEAELQPVQEGLAEGGKGGALLRRGCGVRFAESSLIGRDGR